jgi:endoribonuclease Dicer
MCVWVCVLFMQFSVFMLQIMKEYKLCFEKPRILGLTAPLLHSTCDPGRLEGELSRLEVVLHSAAETASDIVSVLRYI